MRCARDIKTCSSIGLQCEGVNGNNDVEKGKRKMLIGGLGIPEIIVILIVLVLTFGLPIVVIVALVLFFTRRKKSNAGMKKCAFCAYSIPVEATVCRFCGREVGH